MCIGQSWLLPPACQADCGAVCASRSTSALIVSGKGAVNAQHVCKALSEPRAAFPSAIAGAWLQCSSPCQCRFHGTLLAACTCSPTSVSHCRHPHNAPTNRTCTSPPLQKRLTNQVSRIHTVQVWISSQPRLASLSRWAFVIQNTQHPAGRVDARAD